ncbi:Chromosome partition protein Smc [Carpediemonas membranifera]|uniref:Chromosome partition protein Smc n=1 Tax=Carpediemonas membranifera TaxID=201153 RepID=A0A8J6E5I6_9EUKA|nr:Chromosome partition protein Smc [Carpediemonas membranifera]|eukprot:KAG9395812.1 Chromosome partition protein Smc [Carpediemonas membranifera]
MNVLNVLQSFGDALPPSHKLVVHDIINALMTCLYTDGTPAEGLTVHLDSKKVGSAASLHHAASQSGTFAFEGVVSRTWFEESERRANRYETLHHDFMELEAKYEKEQRRTGELQRELTDITEGQSTVEDRIKALGWSNRELLKDKERLAKQVDAAEEEHNAVVDMLVSDRRELRLELDALKKENRALSAALQDQGAVQRTMALNSQLKLDLEAAEDRTRQMEELLRDQTRFIQGSAEADAPTTRMLQVNDAADIRLLELREMRDELVKSLSEALEDPALRHVWRQSIGSTLTLDNALDVAVAVDQTGAGGSRMVKLIDGLKSRLQDTEDQIRKIEIERKKSDFAAPNDGFVEIKVSAESSAGVTPMTTLRFCLGLEEHHGAACPHSLVDYTIPIEPGVRAVRLSHPTTFLKDYAVFSREAASRLSLPAGVPEHDHTPPLAHAILVHFGLVAPPNALSDVRLDQAMGMLWTWSSAVAKAEAARTAGMTGLPFKRPVLWLPTDPANPIAMQERWVAHLKANYGPLAPAAGYRIAVLLAANRHSPLAQFYESVLIQGILQAPAVWLFHRAVGRLEELIDAYPPRELLERFMSVVGKTMHSGLATVFRHPLREAVQRLGLVSPAQTHSVLREAIAAGVMGVVSSRFTERSAIYHKLIIHQLSATGQTEVDASVFEAVICRKMKNIPAQYLKGQFNALIDSAASHGMVLRQLALQLDAFSHVGEITSCSKGIVPARTAAFLAAAIDQIQFFVRPHQWGLETDAFDSDFESEPEEESEDLLDGMPEPLDQCADEDKVSSLPKIEFPVEQLSADETSSIDDQTARIMRETAQKPKKPIPPPPTSTMTKQTIELRLGSRRPSASNPWARHASEKSQMSGPGRGRLSGPKPNPPPRVNPELSTDKLPLPGLMRRDDMWRTGLGKKKEAEVEENAADYLFQ